MRDDITADPPCSSSKRLSIQPQKHLQFHPTEKDHQILQKGLLLSVLCFKASLLAEIMRVWSVSIYRTPTSADI